MYNLALVLLILLFLIISGLLSGIETALTSLSSAQVQRLKLEGSERARKSLRRKKERIITTIIVGNTIVNVFSSSLSTALFVAFFGNNGLIFFTLFITFVVIIFSEILPKTIALYYPEEVLLGCYPKVGFLIRALQPITECFQWIVHLVLRIFKIQQKQEKISAADSIRRLIAMHRSNNNINDQEVEILNSVLDLTELEVHQIMVHRKNVLTVNVNSSESEILETIGRHDYRHIPIWQDCPDNIITVLDARAMFSDYKTSQEAPKAEAYMSKPWFIPDNTLLSIQLNNFRQKNRSFALVVDEYGNFKGIVTLSDIVRGIMGNIQHDTKADVADIVPVAGKSFSMSGEMLIRDVNRRLKWDLPIADASTIAGLIINHAHKIPAENETFYINGFKLKVAKKSHKTIKRVIVGPIKPPL